MAKTPCNFIFFQSSLSPPPWRAANPFDTQDKFSPEPLAHKAVYIKVKAGLEDNEDMIEVSHTEPEAWDRMPASLVQTDTLKCSVINNIRCIAGVLLFSLRYLSMMNISQSFAKNLMLWQSRKVRTTMQSTACSRVCNQSMELKAG